MISTRVAYWTCQIAGWGAYSGVGMAMAARQAGWNPSVIAGYSLFFLYSVALTDLLRREIRRRRWLAGHVAHPFIRLLGAAVAVATLQCFLVVAFDLALERRSPTFGHPEALGGMWVSVTAATVMWTILYVTVTAPRRSREKDVHFQLALREAELRALEAQVNPHFLFNALNSIRGLVVEDPPLAREMITRLANMLRYNLHRDPAHTVPLAAEVEAVKDYLALESVRFEERLRVRWEIDPAASAAPVPPMLLQTLVENAVKHGIAKRPEGGDIVVRALDTGSNLILEVENSGELCPNGAATGQLGLANTRDRLALLYGARATLSLEARGGRVAAGVRLPKTP
jgi:two-component system, LytTR family, sensor kinase